MVIDTPWRKLALGCCLALTWVILGATSALADTPTTTATATATETPTATGTAPVGTPTATPTAGSPTATVTLTPPAGTVTPTQTSVAHDNRYFGQTRFRIDNDTIWD